MDEFKVTFALVPMMQSRWNFARGRKRRGKGEAHQLTIVLKEIKQCGKDLYELLSQPGDALGGLSHQSVSFVMCRVDERLVKPFLIGKVIVECRLRHSGVADNLLHRSRCVPAVREPFERSMENLLARFRVVGDFA